MPPPASAWCAGSSARSWSKKKCKAVKTLPLDLRAPVETVRVVTGGRTVVSWHFWNADMDHCGTAALAGVLLSATTSAPARAARIRPTKKPESCSGCQQERAPMATVSANGLLCGSLRNGATLSCVSV